MEQLTQLNPSKPSSFDPHHPPDTALIDDCVHCGFCLPACPTYVLWGEEMDSPRGRIYMMKKSTQGEAPLDQRFRLHMDNCLGCMACVTACPSGVQYDKLIEDTRAQIERNHDRSHRERLVRQAIFGLFPHPGRLRALAPALAAARALGVTRAARRRRGGLLDRIPQLRTLLSLAPEPRAGAALARLPEHTPARGELRGRVGFLQGGVQRVFFDAVNAATVAV